MGKEKRKPRRRVRARHRLSFFLLRFVGFVMGLMYGCRYRIFRSRRGQNYFILSNHQTLLDPAFVAMSFRAPVYFVAGETLFNDSIPSRLLRYLFAPIKKMKGTVDVACIRAMVRVAKEGGNVAIFPEGNRTWADVPFYIDPAICRLIRLLKLPLLLYRFEGGYGVDPRWGKSRRRGRFVCGVHKELSVEEIAALSDEELYRTVLDALTASDAEGGYLYRSAARAEYLERLLFVCPKCGSISTLRSEGEKVICTKCKLSVVYGEDLHLSSTDPDFHFSVLKEWYAYQLSAVREMKVVPEEAIFRDDGAVLYDKTGEKRITVAEGTCVLKNQALSVADTEISLESIRSVSVVGGRKLVFHTDDRFYILTGDARFNAIKYALVFNILPTGIKEEKYYGLHL